MRLFAEMKLLEERIKRTEKRLDEQIEELSEEEKRDTEYNVPPQQCDPNLPSANMIDYEY